MRLLPFPLARFLSFSFGLALLVAATFPVLSSAAELDRSGPVISLQNTVYQVNGVWHCPLCRQAVPQGDRSNLDLRLQLSEWHDVYIDADYFRTKIWPISDAELVDSLRIPALEPALRAALAAGDQQRLAMLLQDYFTSRPDNGRLSNYDPQNKRSFATIDEFRKDVAADPARGRAITEAVDRIYTPAKGFTLFGKAWGEQIDFNHSYPTASKWGVHYLSFLDSFIAAHLLKPQPAIAGAFERVFNQWYDQIDAVQHEKVINITTSYDFIWYELGLSNRTERLVNALRAFGPTLSPQSHLRLLKIILGSSRWLEQCLTRTPFHPYNWQTHTAHTLSYAALALPEFSDSAAWLRHGRASMEKHIENDILNDGGYVERTTSYAAYMFSVFHRYMLMLDFFAQDRTFLERHLGRLEKFIEFYVLTHTPVGVNAPFNDAGRGKELVPLFKEMSVFFQRGDFVGAVRHEFDAATLAALPFPAVDPKVRSADFPDSRFAVMRDAWKPASHFMIINYGDHQNHSHADQLSFEAYANGVALAVDAGLGKLRYLDPTQVSWYKHSLAHTMLTINQAIPEKRNLPGYDKVWSAQSRTEVFAATHDGYLPFQQARHRRHILSAKEHYWLIIDEVTTTAGKPQEMDFNLHSPRSLREIPDGFASTEDVGFLIKQDRRDAGRTTRLLQKGEADLGGLDQEPSHRDIDWLIFRKTLTGDRFQDRMATLLLPYAAGQRPDPARVTVEQVDLRDPSALAYRVTVAERQDLIIVSDGTYRTFINGVAGDFRYARLSSTAGRVEAASFVTVTRTRIDGLPPLRFDTARDHEQSR